MAIQGAPELAGPAQRSEAPPLCVDLDGTLLQSDMLLESFFAMIRERPVSVLQVPLWLVKGKAHLKAQIARRVDFASSHLPFNEEVMQYVREQRTKRMAVLVTGTHQSLADSVASQLDIFDEVIGSSLEINLTSHQKRELLESRYGVGGFDYIGNDKDDLNVWPAARQAMVVSTASELASLQTQTFNRIFKVRANSLSDYFSLLRVHHWSKNALIAVPFFLDHRFDDGAAFVTVLLAFLCMSLLASATYIFNDMLDLQADRQNSTKCSRALASGTVPDRTWNANNCPACVFTLSYCSDPPTSFHRCAACVPDRYTDILVMAEEKNHARCHYHCRLAYIACSGRHRGDSSGMVFLAACIFDVLFLFARLGQTRC